MDPHLIPSATTSSYMKCKFLMAAKTLPRSLGGIPGDREGQCVPAGVEINRPFTAHNYKCYQEIEFMKNASLHQRERPEMNCLSTGGRPPRSFFAFRIIQKWLEELDNAV